MGGEILIPMLFVGMLAGLAGATLVIVVSKFSPARKIILAITVFAIGATLPTAIFLAYGSFVRATSPIKSTVSVSHFSQKPNLPPNPDHQ